MAYPGGMTVDTGGGSGTTILRSEMSLVLFGGLASMEAGAVHAAAAGIHAEHRQLAQLFIVIAALQLGVGLWAVVRSSRAAAWAVVGVNAAAIAGWLYTRLAGLSWIEGLEVREAPQFADTACALLAAVAVFAAYTGAILPPERRQQRGLVIPAVVLGMFAVWTMLAAGTHVHSREAEAADGHSHGTEEVADAGHAHGTEEAAADGAAAAEAVDAGASDMEASDVGEGHAHTAEESAAEDGHVHIIDPAAAPPAEPAALAWPRPWDPTQPVDLSGVPGVTAEQQLRAMKLVDDTLAALPRFADPADAIAAGYSSIGDAGTGSEHFIKADLIEDDDLLDPLAPESLVYSVENGQRTLAGAMYIASARPADDPSLTEWAGPLMTWHKHDNLCWSVDENGAAKVVGIIDANGNCANGVRTGGANPMVHVWIQPHPCGVFAALEGIGAGTAGVPEDQRVDVCSAEHDHGTTAPAAPAAVAKPYDPTLPIDLSGTPGVTPQQQAAAENLIAVTLVELPQWSDYRVAEAAGFKSIGDAGTGHEHFVQWDWIEDDVILDPNYPESLVYEPQPDGSKKLVSAMYMTASSIALEDVPNIGGDLMQWHIHNNLCYSGWPEHPRVSGITSPNGACPTGFVNPPPAPMIHVWIVPQECGPFAALEGVGAGQIEAGAERLCDTAHGGH